MYVDRITTVEEPASSYALATLAQIKAELGLPSGLQYVTSEDTASGQVLNFLATGGIQATSTADGSPATVAGPNIAIGCVVAQVTATTVVLSLPVVGAVPAGSVITFGNDNLLDTYLTNKATQVSWEIQDHCRRTFAVDTLQDVAMFPRNPNDWMLKPDNHILQLAKWPVQSVTSVVVMRQGVATTLVAGTDYMVDGAAGQLIRLRSNDANIVSRPWEPATTTIIYEAGFTSLPGSVLDVCLQLVTKAYWGRGRDPSIIETNSAMAGGTKYWFDDNKNGNLPPNIRDILSTYRVPAFG